VKPFGANHVLGLSPEALNPSCISVHTVNHSLLEAFLVPHSIYIMYNDKMSNTRASRPAKNPAPATPKSAPHVGYGMVWYSSQWFNVPLNTL